MRDKRDGLRSRLSIGSESEPTGVMYKYTCIVEGDPEHSFTLESTASVQKDSILIHKGDYYKVLSSHHNLNDAAQYVSTELSLIPYSNKGENMNGELPSAELKSMEYVYDLELGEEVKQLRSPFPLKVGDIFHIGRYRFGIDQIFHRFSEDGEYLGATIQKRYLNLDQVINS